MRSPALTLTAVLSCVTLCNCGDDSTSSKSTPYRYPLTVGSIWTYERSVIVDYQGSQQSDSVVGEITVEAVGTDPTVASSVILRSTLEEGGLQFSAEGVYKNESTGLLLYAERGPGGGAYESLPKKSILQDVGLDWPLAGSSLGGSDWNETDLDADTVRFTPPLVALAYPLETVSDWITRTTDDLGDLTKTMVGKRQVSTQAGQFGCFEIKWEYANDSSITVYEYLDTAGTVGLVKRFYEILNVEVGSPPDTDTADIRIVLLLEGTEN